MLSLTCEYAIRALTFLATQNPESTTLSTQISKEANIPSAYLSKILLILKDHGILDSLKGPGGGFFFIVEPTELTLKEVVALFDPAITSDNNCIMGLEECGGDFPCPIHDIWGPFRDRFFKILSSTSIATMAEDVKMKRAFLDDVATMRKRIHRVH